jgi:hypothetical protein
MNVLYLWGADTGRGWRVTRRATLDEGNKKVLLGKWREVHDQVTCELIGFQVISTAAARVDRDLESSDNHSAAISANEMNINAGCRGTSRTAGLSEDLRLERKMPEDFIERTLQKIRVFPYVGARRGDILRVWPKT